MASHYQRKKNLNQSSSCRMEDKLVPSTKILQTTLNSNTCSKHIVLVGSKTEAETLAWQQKQKAYFNIPKELKMNQVCMRNFKAGKFQTIFSSWSWSLCKQNPISLCHNQPCNVWTYISKCWPCLDLTQKIHIYQLAFKMLQ
jgi:hypothetical protein